MSTMTEQLKLRAIEQSAQSISLQMNLLEGVTNGLTTGTHNTAAFEQQLKQIRSQIEHELENIRFVTAQGRLPASPEERALGLKVQEAIREITQI